MKSSGRKISFLVTKVELELLEEVCEYGADADEVLEEAKREGKQYRLTFSYEELDDLIGFVANSANHEDSRHKEKKLHALFGKLDSLLKVSDKLNRSKDVLLKTEENTQPHAAKPLALKYFIFDVWLEWVKGEKILRKIQIAETKSLYNFAKAITQAFDFYFDHCFAFYENMKANPPSGKVYELFVDIGEEPTAPGAKGVKKVKINQAFKSPGEKMTFFFDYGDSWKFFVELKEIKQAEKWDLKPVVLESIGKAPEQYPISEQAKHLYQE